MPNPDCEKYEQKYNRQRQAEQDQATSSLRELCEQLTALGVSTVVGRYDGYGDSGQFDAIDAYSDAADPGDGNRGQSEVALSPEHVEKLTDAFFVFLPGGFEINEGGFGDLILEVKNHEVRLEHNHRIETSEYSEELWEL